MSKLEEKWQFFNSMLKSYAALKNDVYKESPMTVEMLMVLNLKNKKQTKRKKSNGIDLKRRRFMTTFTIVSFT